MGRSDPRHTPGRGSRDEQALTESEQRAAEKHDCKCKLGASDRLAGSQVTQSRDRSRGQTSKSGRLGTSRVAQVTGVSSTDKGGKRLRANHEAHDQCIETKTIMNKKRKNRQRNAHRQESQTRHKSEGR